MRRRMAKIAAGQHGLITTPQLRGVGFGKRTIHRWAKDGRLHRVRRGVYLVGRPGLTQRSRWLAAVLAEGDGALLSHLSAAALHRLLERDPLTVDVTVRSNRRPRDGIRLHTPSLQPAAAERTTVNAIPVTSPARTFVDLASMVGRRTLTDALRAGQRHGDLEPLALLPSLRPSRGRRGVALAREVLSAYVPAPRPVRSGLEQEYWELCVEHGPPLPLVNVPIASYEADFVWAGLALIVETDGDAWHRTDVDRVRDAERDAVHRALGYTVVRVPEAELRDRPHALAAHRERLRQAVERR